MSRTAAIVADLDTESDHLDVAPILAIHRHPEGYVGFVRKPSEPRQDRDGKPIQFETLASIKVSELEQMFPAIAHHLVKDSYFTVSSMYRAAPYLNKTTGLPDVWRKEAHLKTLNACYADLDVGRPESDLPEQRQTWGEAAGRVLDAIDAGTIPQASIIARSGRGVYVFWLLRDDREPHLPPKGDAKYHPEKLALYKLVNQAICRRLQHVAADERAHDGARVLRVPGSLHTKVNRRVTYLLLADDRGKGYTYTLSELAALVGVKECAESLPDQTRRLVTTQLFPKFRGRETKLPGSQPSRVAGRIKLNALRAADLVTLEAHYKGWPKGRRRFLLDLYAQFLHHAGNAPQDVLTAVKVMAANCRPPYPSDPSDDSVVRIVEQATRTPKTRRTPNAALCRWLKVTPELARSLALQTILPPEVVAERKPPPGGRRAQHLADLTEFVRLYLERHPVVTCRGMTNAALHRGFTTNRDTVNKIMNALGYVVRGPGRPKGAVSYSSKKPKPTRKSVYSATHPPQQNAATGRIERSFTSQPPPSGEISQLGHDQDPNAAQPRGV